MLLVMVILFWAGVGNFAMHRAMRDVADPELRAMVTAMLRVTGPHLPYVLEFALLVGMMLLARAQPGLALALYGSYTAINIATFRWINGR